MDTSGNIIVDKSNAFTNRIIKLGRYLREHKASSTITNQIERSGLSIGANVREGVYGQSKADFISKLSIALKESNETQFWIEKLFVGEYITAEQYKSMNDDVIEIIRLLTSIINTAKKNNA